LAPVLAKVLEFPPIRYLGRISYGLYLWHYSFFCVLWQLHFHQNTIGTAALVGGLSLTCSVLSFHFVEQPILKVKDKLIVKQPAKEPATVDATA
jgi:peptidoglycan/LPS O-acetylase OafA/YrhL